MPKLKLESVETANKYGFDWPPTNDKMAHVQVVRVSSIFRGARGHWRVLAVGTEKAKVHLYISPTGLIRVFEEGKGEMKHGPQTRDRKDH